MNRELFIGNMSTMAKSIIDHNHSRSLADDFMFAFYVSGLKALNLDFDIDLLEIIHGLKDHRPEYVEYYINTHGGVQYTKSRRFDPRERNKIRKVL